ncbi:MAG: hypothetical protein E7497_02995 [Ruminococcus sp.]|nr:hypothetical protein [Ruminococcus sp.]
MKAFRVSDYIKEIFIICIGLVLLFVPDILSKIFSFIGIAVIAVSIITAVFGTKGPDRIMKCVGGILIGFLITLIPSFIEVGIPVAIGFIMLISGLGRIFTALAQKKSSGGFTAGLVFGIILSVIGAVFIFSPLTLTALIKRLLAGALIAYGIISIIVKYLSGGRRNSGNGNVIDINSYTIRND